MTEQDILKKVEKALAQPSPDEVTSLVRKRMSSFIGGPMDPDAVKAAAENLLNDLNGPNVKVEVERDPLDPSVYNIKAQIPFMVQHIYGVMDESDRGVRPGEDCPEGGEETEGD